MKKLIVLLIAVAFFSCKKEKNQAKQEAKEEVKVETTQENEWVMLFDGKSMDNWRGYGIDTMFPEWSIEDESLKFTPSKEGGKNIISKNKYTNFMLSLEWKASKNGNSGVFWSVHEDVTKFKESYETAPEIQVLDNDGHPDAKVAGGTHSAGSLYDMIACPPEFINPAGEWNWMVLEVNQDANLAKVRMNGKEVMTFPLHGEEWDKMVAGSKFSDWEGFGKYRTGHLGLQDHGDIVWYKNIKIKEL